MTQRELVRTEFRLQIALEQMRAARLVVDKRLMYMSDHLESAIIMCERVLATVTYEMENYAR